NLEKIRASASSAFVELYEDEGSVCSKLALASRSLEELHRYDASFEPYREPLAAAKATVEDLSLFLRDYLGKLRADPRRRDEVDQVGMEKTRFEIHFETRSPAGNAPGAVSPGSTEGASVLDQGLAAATGPGGASASGQADDRSAAVSRSGARGIDEIEMRI